MSLSNNHAKLCKSVAVNIVRNIRSRDLITFRIARKIVMIQPSF